MSAPNFIRLTVHHGGPLLVNLNDVRSIGIAPDRGARLTYCSGDTVVVAETFDEVIDRITSMSLDRFSRISSVDPS